MPDIFDVIADPTRRQLLERLASRGEAAVGDLVEALGITQPTVSKHLAVLREAGVVTVREDGRNRYYAVRLGPLEQVEAFLDALAVGSGPAVGPDGGGPTIFAAWDGAEMGGRVGRVAADTAHSARVALEAAQEKLVGAQRRVSEKMPRWRRQD